MLAGAGTATAFGLGAGAMLAFAASLARTTGLGLFGAPLFSTRFPAPVLTLFTISTSEAGFTTATFAAT